MNWLRHTIKDDCIRDMDTDNIVEEKRVERKFLWGLCLWEKSAEETNEFIKIEKRKLGF